jgi:hypothetical protein
MVKLEDLINDPDPKPVKKVVRKKATKPRKPRVNKDKLREEIVEWIGYVANGHKQYKLAGCNSVSELKAKIISNVYKL